MPIARFCKPPAGVKVDSLKYRLRSVLCLAGLALFFAGCTPTPPVPVAVAPPPVPPALPFDQAVLKAANAVFSAAPVSSATRPDAAPDRQLVVIDPLVDGVTGEQSDATRAIGARIVDLAREKYPQFDIEPFSPETVGRSPYVMVGTFTPVNAENRTTGDREAFRFCLVMADLRSGKTVAKGVARAQLTGVDTTPIAFFRDSPAWTDDAQIKSYINTCQATKVGDPINPLYIDGILTASVIGEAIEAYNAGRYRDAIDLYSTAKASKSGGQLRVYNGLYLSNWKLGRQEPAADAFGEVVDYGLSNNRLGVKFLFRPGSTGLETVAGGPPYEMWLQQIANHAGEKGVCLQVVGNTSKSGPPALNDRISLLRAEYIKGRLQDDNPVLNGHVIANGAGSQANLIGTGADNESDALDRRVDFKVIPAC